MCLFLETIKIENGSPCNLEYHQRRVDSCRATLPGNVRPLDLSALRYPHDLPAGVFKWRIVYGDQISENTVECYRPKKIRTVKLVVRNDMTYAYKYAERSVFTGMLAEKGTCDDILVVKHGLLTDMSYANIALFDGTTWCTPRTPLLAGTCRTRLLDLARIREADIRPSDLGGFIMVSVINAMLDLGELTFPVSGIIP